MSQCIAEVEQNIGRDFRVSIPTITFELLTCCYLQKHRICLPLLCLQIIYKIIYTATVDGSELQRSPVEVVFLVYPMIYPRGFFALSQPSWVKPCKPGDWPGFDSGWQLPFLPTEPEQQQGWLAEGAGRLDSANLPTNLTKLLGN